MRGKLRDKRAEKRDRLKREMMGRRPAKRDNRYLPLTQQTDDEGSDYELDELNTLEEEKELTIEDDQKN